MDKFALGWCPHWHHLLDECDQNNLVRITQRNREYYSAFTVCGAELSCRLSGKLADAAQISGQFPASGDWCVVREVAQPPDITIIERLLERKSKIARTNAGTTSHEQVLAANVDYVFITTSANRDFNLNRLRRYILTAISGNTTPVVVLSKSDLPGADCDNLRSLVYSTFSEVLCFETSAVAGTGIHQIDDLLKAGKTGVFIGSSGVGKSSLVNSLLQTEAQATRDIREADSKGRHTTSSSDLFFTPRGGIIIDTPGLREIAVIADEEDLACMMPGIARFAAECRFCDCSHTIEPDCRVRDAVAEGELAESAFIAYAKLQREIDFSKRKIDQRLASEQRKLWKQRTKRGRERMREKRRGLP